MPNQATQPSTTTLATPAQAEAVTVMVAARHLAQTLGLTPRTWAERLRKFDPRKSVFVELAGVVRFRHPGDSITVDVATLEQWIEHQRQIAVAQSRPTETVTATPDYSRYSELIAGAEANGQTLMARAYRKLAAKGL